MAYRVDNSDFYQGLDDLRGRLGLGSSRTSIEQERSRTGFWQTADKLEAQAMRAVGASQADQIWGRYDRFGQYNPALTPPWRTPVARQSWQTIVDTRQLFTPEVRAQYAKTAMFEGGMRHPELTRGRFFTHLWAEQVAYGTNRETPAGMAVPRAVSLADRLALAPTAGEELRGWAVAVAENRFGADAATATANLLAPRGNRGLMGTMWVNAGVMLDKLHQRQMAHTALDSSAYGMPVPAATSHFAEAARTSADLLGNLGVGVFAFRAGMWLAESWAWGLTQTGHFFREMNTATVQRATDALAARPGTLGTRAWQAAAGMSQGFEALRGGLFVLESEVTRSLIRAVAPMNVAMNGDVGRNYNADIDRIFSEDWYRNVETHNTRADATAALAARTRLTHGSLHPLPDGRWQVVFSTATPTPMTYENRFHLVSEHMRAHASTLGGGMGAFLDFVNPIVNDDARVARAYNRQGWGQFITGQFAQARMSWGQSADASLRARHNARAYAQYGGGPTRAMSSTMLNTVIGAVLFERISGHFMAASPFTLERQVDAIEQINRPAGQIGYMDWTYANPLQSASILEAVPNTMAAGAYGLGWGAVSAAHRLRRDPGQAALGMALTGAAAAAAFGAVYAGIDRWAGPRYQAANWAGRYPGLGTVAAQRGRGLWGVLAAGAVGGAVGYLTGLFGSQASQESARKADWLLRTPQQVGGNRLPVQMHYRAGWDSKRDWFVSMPESIAEGVAAFAKNMLLTTQAYREGGAVLKMLDQRTATAMGINEFAREFEGKLAKSTLPANEKSAAQARVNYLLDRARDWVGAKSESEVSLSGVEAIRLGDLRSFGLVGVRLTSGTKSTFMVSAIAPMPMAFMVGGKLPVYRDWHRGAKQFETWYERVDGNATRRPFDRFLTERIAATGGEDGWVAGATREALSWGFESGTNWEGLARLGVMGTMEAARMLPDGPETFVGAYAAALGGSAYASYLATGGAARGTMMQRMTGWALHGIDPGMSLSVSKNLTQVAAQAVGPERSNTRFWLGRMPYAMASAAQWMIHAPVKAAQAPLWAAGNLTEMTVRTAGRTAGTHLALTGSWIDGARAYSWEAGNWGRAHRAIGVAGGLAMMGLMGYTAYHWLRANRAYEKSETGFFDVIDNAERSLRESRYLNFSDVFRPGAVAANMFRRFVNTTPRHMANKLDTYRYRMTPTGSIEGGEIRPEQGGFAPGWRGWREALGRSLSQVWSGGTVEGLQTAMISTGQTGFDIYMRLDGDTAEFNNPETHVAFGNNWMNLKTNVVARVLRKGNSLPETEYMFAKAMGADAMRLSRGFPGRRRPAFMGKMFLNTGMKGSSPVFDLSPALRLAMQQRFAASDALLAGWASEARWNFGDYYVRKRAPSFPGRDPLFTRVLDLDGRRPKNTDFATYTVSRFDNEGRPVAQFRWGFENVDIMHRAITRGFEGLRSDAGLGPVMTGATAQRWVGLFRKFNQAWDEGAHMAEVADDDALFEAFPNAPASKMLRMPTQLRTMGDFTTNWLNAAPGVRASMAFIGVLVAGTMGAAALRFTMNGLGRLDPGSLFGRAGSRWSPASYYDDFTNRLDPNRRERWGRLRGSLTRPTLTPAGVYAMSHQGVGLAELELPIGPDRRMVRFGDFQGRPFSNLTTPGGAISVTAEEKAHHYRRVWHQIGNLYEGIGHTRSSMTLLDSLDELEQQLQRLRPSPTGRPVGWVDSPVLDELLTDTRRMMADVHARHVAAGHAPFRVGETRGGRFVAAPELQQFERLVQRAMYNFGEAANLRQVQFEPLRQGAGLGWGRGVNAWSLVEDPNLVHGAPRAPLPLHHLLTDIAQNNELAPGLRAVNAGYAARGPLGLPQHLARGVGAAGTALGTVGRGLDVFLMRPLMVYNVSMGLLASAADDEDVVGGRLARQAYKDVGAEWTASTLEMASLAAVGRGLGAAGQAIGAIPHPATRVVGFGLQAAGFGFNIAAGVVPFAGAWFRPALEERFEQRRAARARYDALDAVTAFDRTALRAAHWTQNVLEGAKRRHPTLRQIGRDLFNPGQRADIEHLNWVWSWAEQTSKNTNREDQWGQFWAGTARNVAGIRDALTAAGRAHPYARTEEGRSFSLSSWLSRSPIFWGPNDLYHENADRVPPWWRDAWLGYEKQRQVQMMVSADPIGSSMFDMVAPEVMGMEPPSDMAPGFRALYGTKGRGAAGLGNAGAARAFQWRAVPTMDSIIESELKRRAIMHEMTVIGGGLNMKGYAGHGGYKRRSGTWLGQGAASGQASGKSLRPLKRGEEAIVMEAVEGALGFVRVPVGAGIPLEWAREAAELERRYGIPALVTLTQGQKESSMGRAGQLRDYHNYFGLNVKSLREPHLSDPRGYNWATFRSMREGFEGYAKFLQQDRYRAAFKYKNDPERFLQEVYKAGYDENKSNVISALGIMRTLRTEVERAGKTVLEGTSSVAKADRDRAKRDLEAGIGRFWSRYGGSVDNLVDGQLSWLDPKSRTGLKMELKNQLYRRDRWTSWEDPEGWQKRDQQVGIRPTDRQRAEWLVRAAARLYPQSKLNLNSVQKPGVHVETAGGMSMLVADGYTMAFTSDYRSAHRPGHAGVDFSIAPVDPKTGKGDFSRALGSPVVARQGGKVVRSEWYGGYGWAVEVEVAPGVTNLYGHLRDEPTLKVGSVIAAGTRVGPMGSTGRSTGPHLHFEVRYKGADMDPYTFNAAYPITGGPDRVTAAALSWLEQHVGPRTEAQRDRYNYDYIAALVNSPIQINGKALTREQANNILFMKRMLREDEGFTQLDGPGRTGPAWMYPAGSTGPGDTGETTDDTGTLLMGLGGVLAAATTFLWGASATMRWHGKARHKAAQQMRNNRRGPGGPGGAPWWASKSGPKPKGPGPAPITVYVDPATGQMTVGNPSSPIRTSPTTGTQPAVSTAWGDPQTQWVGIYEPGAQQALDAAVQAEEQPVRTAAREGSRALGARVGTFAQPHVENFKFRLQLDLRNTVDNAELRIRTALNFIPTVLENLVWPLPDLIRSLAGWRSARANPLARAQRQYDRMTGQAWWQQRVFYTPPADPQYAPDMMAPAGQPLGARQRGRATELTTVVGEVTGPPGRLLTEADMLVSYVGAKGTQRVATEAAGIYWDDQKQEWRAIDWRLPRGVGYAQTGVESSGWTVAKSTLGAPGPVWGAERAGRPQQTLLVALGEAAQSADTALTNIIRALDYQQANSGLGVFQPRLGVPTGASLPGATLKGSVSHGAGTIAEPMVIRVSATFRPDADAEVRVANLGKKRSVVRDHRAQLLEGAAGILESFGVPGGEARAFFSKPRLGNVEAARYFTDRVIEMVSREGQAVPEGAREMIHGAYVSMMQQFQGHAFESPAELTDQLLHRVVGAFDAPETASRTGLIARTPNPEIGLPGYDLPITDGINLGTPKSKTSFFKKRRGSVVAPHEVVGGAGLTLGRALRDVGRTIGWAFKRALQIGFSFIDAAMSARTPKEFMAHARINTFMYKSIDVIERDVLDVPGRAMLFRARVATREDMASGRYQNAAGWYKYDHWTAQPRFMHGQYNMTPDAAMALDKVLWKRPVLDPGLIDEAWYAMHTMLHETYHSVRSAQMIKKIHKDPYLMGDGYQWSGIVAAEEGLVEGISFQKIGRFARAMGIGGAILEAIDARSLDERAYPRWSLTMLLVAKSAAGPGGDPKRFHEAAQVLTERALMTTGFENRMEFLLTEFLKNNRVLSRKQNLLNSRTMVTRASVMFKDIQMDMTQGIPHMGREISGVYNWNRGEAETFDRLMKQMYRMTDNAWNLRRSIEVGALRTLRMGERAYFKPKHLALVPVTGIHMQMGWTSHDHYFRRSQLEAQGRLGVNVLPAGTDPIALPSRQRTRPVYNAEATYLNLEEVFPGEVDIRYETEHIRLQGIFYKDEGLFHTTWVSKREAPAWQKGIEMKGVYGRSLLRLFKRLESEYGLKVSEQRGDSLPTSFGAKQKFWGNRFSAQQGMSDAYDAWDIADDVDIGVSLTRINLRPVRESGPAGLPEVQALRDMILAGERVRDARSLREMERRLAQADVLWPGQAIGAALRDPMDRIHPLVRAGRVTNRVGAPRDFSLPSTGMREIDRGRELFYMGDLVEGLSAQRAGLTFTWRLTKARVVRSLIESNVLWSLGMRRDQAANIQFDFDSTAPKGGYVDRTVVINLAKATTLSDIVETMAHELYHHARATGGVRSARLSGESILAWATRMATTSAYERLYAREAAAAGDPSVADAMRTEETEAHYFGRAYSQGWVSRLLSRTARRTWAGAHTQKTTAGVETGRAMYSGYAEPSRGVVPYVARAPQDGIVIDVVARETTASRLRRGLGSFESFIKSRRLTLGAHYVNQGLMVGMLGFSAYQAMFGQSDEEKAAGRFGTALIGSFLAADQAANFAQRQGHVLAAGRIRMGVGLLGAALGVYGLGMGAYEWSEGRRTKDYVRTAIGQLTAATSAIMLAGMLPNPFMPITAPVSMVAGMGLQHWGTHSIMHHAGELMHAEERVEAVRRVSRVYQEHKKATYGPVESFGKFQQNLVRADQAERRRDPAAAIFADVKEQVDEARARAEVLEQIRKEEREAALREARKNQRTEAERAAHPAAPAPELPKVVAPKPAQKQEVVVRVARPEDYHPANLGRRDTAPMPAPGPVVVKQNPANPKHKILSRKQERAGRTDTSTKFPRGHRNELKGDDL